MNIEQSACSPLQELLRIKQDGNPLRLMTVLTDITFAQINELTREDLADLARLQHVLAALLDGNY
jgi:hypothetical protein